jgi:hypothetical protein
MLLVVVVVVVLLNYAPSNMSSQLPGRRMFMIYSALLYLCQNEVPQVRQSAQEQDEKEELLKTKKKRPIRFSKKEPS